MIYSFTLFRFSKIFLSSIFLTLITALVSYASTADKVFQAMDEERKIAEEILAHKRPLPSSGAISYQLDAWLSAEGYKRAAPHLEILRREFEITQNKLAQLSRELELSQSLAASQLTQVMSRLSVAEERASAFQSEAAQAQFWRSLYEQERAKLRKFEERGDGEIARSAGESSTTSMFGDTYSFVSNDERLSGAEDDEEVLSPLGSRTPTPTPDIES